MATYATHKVHEQRGVVVGSGTTDRDRWTFNRQMLQTSSRFNTAQDVQGAPSRTEGKILKGSNTKSK